MKLPERLRSRYRAERALGSGAFGVVVLAEDRELGRRVAIKLLHPDESASALSRARLEREALLTARLGSAHVVKVFDHDVTGAQAWIVYEFVEGRTLREHLKASGVLPPAEAVRLAGELLAGLEALHEAGVLHRDLKPANVMLTGEGAAVLIDLGLGWTEQGETLTGTGVFMGSPAYMPPEQMTGGEPGVTWDLYAAAMVTTEMLVGDVPLLGDNLPHTYNCKCRGLERGLGGEGYRVAAELDAVLTRALSPEPGDRFPDAAALRHALEVAGAAASGHPEVQSDAWTPFPEVPPAPGPAATPAAESGRRMRRAGLLVGLLGGLGLLLALSAGRPGPPPPPAPGLPSAPAAEGTTARELADLRAAVEGDPSIRAAVELGSDVDREQALATWHRGRAALRRLVGEHQLSRWVDAWTRRRPRAEVQDHAGRLLLVQELLRRTTIPGIEPLFVPGEDPHLGALVARGVALREEAALTGPVEAPWPQRRDRYRAALAAGGRRWLTLRRFEDLLHPDRPELEVVSDLQVRNMAGERFHFPIPKQGSFLVDDVYSPKDREQAKLAASEVVLRLEPTSGDLYLAFQVHGWVTTAHLVLELKGREQDVLVPLYLPRLEGPARVGCCNVRQGFVLRARREVLPEGLSRLRISIRGLQPLGTPKSALNLEELHQLVEGPPPDGFPGG